MTQEMFTEIMQHVDLQVDYFIGDTPDFKDSWHYKPYLYLLERNGVIFYVGQTTRLKSRFNMHKKNKIFDSFYIIECPVKTVRFIRYDPYRKKNEHEYYLLSTLLENYFITVLRTTLLDGGNRRILNLNLIRFMKIYDGVHKWTKDIRMDWRHNTKMPVSR